MNSGWYILGEELKAFEAEFAEYYHVKHTVGVGNGLDVLHLMLRAMGVGEGDEGLSSDKSYIQYIINSFKKNNFENNIR